MPKSFLWVNKDVSSEKLSQSTPTEERLMRRHAQHNRLQASNLPRALRRETQANSQQDAFYLVACAAPSIPRSLEPTSLDLSSDETRSLAFFVSRTARNWTGWDDASFWNTEVLKAGQRSKAITHGLISLSAVHESLENENDRAPLHHLALTQLSKAIRELNAPKLSYLEALMSCIVLMCIQNAQNRRQSYQMLRSGEKMLQELDIKVSRGDIALSSSEYEILETYIRPLLDRLRARLCIVRSPVATLAISVKANRHPSDLCMPSVPDKFSTLRNARECLRAILDWGKSKLPQCHSSHSSISRRSEFTTLLRHLCTLWETALSRSPTSRSSLEPQKIQRSKKLMHTGCLFGRILLECFGTSNECIYDDYIPEFATIMQLAEETAQNSDMSFGIDSGLLDIVAFVGKSCRDPRIRRSAMTFLARGQRVEGDRVSFIAARILQTLIDLEEKGLDMRSCHDVPEARRWRVLQGAQYLSQGQLRLDLIRSSDSESSLRVWIPIPVPGISESSQNPEPSVLPDIIFGGGFVAFLDMSEKEGYFQFCSDSFYFPIPRV